MAVNRTSRSGLFLLELIIAILFFAVTSAVCANLFVQAHLTSAESSKLTSAAREVQSAAELVKAADGDLEKLAVQLDATASPGRLDIGFDNEWNRTDVQSAVYTVTVLCGGQCLQLPDGGVLSPEKAYTAHYFSATVVAWDEKGEILQVPVEKYLG